MLTFSKSSKTICGIALALSVLTVACSDETVAPNQALPVDLYNVQTMDVPVVSRLTGRANPTRKAEVRPQVSGIIQKRLFVEGSYVKQGEQLYQIDPSLYQASVDSAKASLQSAQATAHTTKLKADRYKKLLNQNAVSKQDYDDAQAAYLQADASVQQAKAQLQTAEINLAYTKVYAPISGQIDRSNFTEGALVSAQQADPLTTIQQLDPMYVDLGQSVEANLQLRQSVSEGTFRLSNDKPIVDFYFSNGQKYDHQGTLEFAEVSVDESTGMVNLRAIVPNPDHIILPGMFLRGDISEGQLTDAVVVPQDAITREAAGAAYVYVVDENSLAQRRDVTLGINYQNYYVVTNGLKAGETIVTTNLQKVRSNTPVVDAKKLQQPSNQATEQQQ